VAHDAALALGDGPLLLIALGVSDRALGTSFDAVLRQVQSVLPPQTAITPRLGQSLEIRGLYERSDIDLAIVRRENASAEGEVLGDDALDWRAPAAWIRPDGPLPLITLPPPCGVRAVALKVPDRAGQPWREAFVSGSCGARAGPDRADSLAT
jgi:hypothetical protein